MLAVASLLTADRVTTPILRYTIVTVPAHPPKPFPYTLATAGLILLSVLLNLIYLGCHCPLDLAPDEAHYWHWSRHLDWAYYSKGPMVAWLIRASCTLFGGLSVAVTGSEALAVRLPAVLCHAALLAGCSTLAVRISASPRLGLHVVVLALTLPVVTTGAVLMTIDGPFLACWCWGLVFVGKAVERPGVRWWLAAGSCCLIGVLAKYPMLFFPVIVFGFLLAHRTRHCYLRQPGFWLMFGLTGLGCLPILLWNAMHDWVSLRHVIGQTGLDTVRNIHWLGPLGFVAGQFGLLLGYWFVAVAAAVWRYRNSGNPAIALLWWGGVSMWGLFLTASLVSAGQVNWPIASYISGLPLAALWWSDSYDRGSDHGRWYIRLGLLPAFGLGLTLTLLLHYPGLAVRPVVTVLGSGEGEQPGPLRRIDPTCRLRGWRTLAAAVDGLRDRVRRETGQEPVLAAMTWTIPGELSFYCSGHPEAYSLGLALGDRHSQYDLWQPNPIANAQAFLGRPFIYVGDEIPDAPHVFDRMETPIRVQHCEQGVLISSWTVWVGYGYRGFSPDNPQPLRANY